MSCKPTLLHVVVIVCSIFSFSSAQAQWNPDGVPVCQAPENQMAPVVIQDGAGGAIIAWRDFRINPSSRDVFAQRVDALGNVLWTVDGVALSNPAVMQVSHWVVSDGAGGAILAWYEGTYPEVDIYAQRVDSLGTVAWMGNGQPICTATGTQWDVDLIADGAGGAIIVWEDQRSGNFDIYIQRVNADGDTLWPADGVPVAVVADTQADPKLLSDGAGGAFVTWRDRRGAESAIYAQRIDANGTPLWAANGQPLALSPFSQARPQIVTDGSGGAIIAWEDERNGGVDDIYARRITALGDTLWAQGGVAVVTDPNIQRNPRMIADGFGGAIVIWEDNRSGDDNFFGQRIDGNGAVVWTVDGVDFASSTGEQFDGMVATDGAGGAIVSWIDYSDPNDDFLRAQRVDSLGTLLWDSIGVAVTQPETYPEQQWMVTDGDGGAFVAWFDYRNFFDTDIYVQRIEGMFGQWGIRPPILTSAEDVPADQGGFVAVNWLASPVDVFDNQSITHYSVWRATETVNATLPLDDERVDLTQVGSDYHGCAYRVDESYFWEWVGNTDALYFEGYSYTVPTLNDSMAGNDGVHYFQVVAHTAEPFVFWASPPDSGYSVDNLSPVMPGGFAGTYDSGLVLMDLRWDANPEADLSHYAVYRGVGDDFMPSSQNRIATSIDPQVADLPYAPQLPYFLKLSAIDIHGNESPFAVLPPDSVTVPVLLASYHASWSHDRVEVAWVLSEVPHGVTFDVARRGASGGEYETLEFAVERDGVQVRFEDADVVPGAAYAYRVTANVDGARTLLFETTVSVPALELSLQQNYPNPFNPATTIAFSLPSKMPVRLAVYNVAGQVVRVIVDAEVDRGVRSFEWDGRNGGGQPVSSGVYYYRLLAGGKTFTRSMVLLK